MLKSVLSQLTIHSMNMEDLNWLKTQNEKSL
jgi:hypothetical protein